jgi:GTP1/Obg family GTP-binding protein
VRFHSFLFFLFDFEKVEHLRKELEEIQENVHLDTHDHLNKVVESHKETNQQLKMLEDLISQITSKTNQFAAKFPELEGLPFFYHT